MKMLLALGLTISLQLSASPWDTTPCEVLLTVDVFENDAATDTVAQRFIDYIEANKTSHRLIRRDGNRFQIVTQKPEDFVLLESRGGPVLENVWLNGKPVRTLNARQKSDSNISKNEFARQLRQSLFLGMSLLPEGIYFLTDTETGSPATMSVRVEKVGPSYSFPLDSLGLVIEIWPGQHLLPQNEASYKSLRIASFDSRPGVFDSIDAHWEGSELFLMYSLPYGYGEDGLKIEFSQDFQLQTIKTAGGRLFKFDLLYPVN